MGNSFLPGDRTNPVDPGQSLVCVTSNVNTYCCRDSDHPGSGPVLHNTVNRNGSITRSYHTQQIRLNRKRPDVMSPTGVYIYEIPDGSDNTTTHRANITLTNGECMT